MNDIHRSIRWLSTAPRHRIGYGWQFCLGKRLHRAKLTIVHGHQHPTTCDARRSRSQVREKSGSRIRVPIVGSRRL